MLILTDTVDCTVRPLIDILAYRFTWPSDVSTVVSRLTRLVRDSARIGRWRWLADDEVDVDDDDGVTLVFFDLPDALLLAPDGGRFMTVGLDMVSSNHYSADQKFPTDLSACCEMSACSTVVQP